MWLIFYVSYIYTAGMIDFSGAMIILTVMLLIFVALDIHGVSLNFMAFLQHSTTFLRVVEIALRSVKEKIT